MTNLIILLIVSIVVYFTRNIWSKQLVKLFFLIKKNPIEKKHIISNNIDTINPVGTVRTFYLALDITENGNGSVSITVNKDTVKLNK